MKLVFRVERGAFCTVCDLELELEVVSFYGYGGEGGIASGSG